MVNIVKNYFRHLELIYKKFTNGKIAAAKNKVPMWNLKHFAKLLLIGLLIIL